ncbi:MFS transporter [Rhodobacter ferrooxidans]|uniref:Major facilitator superfamily MFS_1 n=1 Tax=Rhodobacter ferrooxidans TaxID=371731 RepID=C8S2J3_9RHOB|nr:MFS transporter [Rhodobacter sp. SW2]EEW24864.1 major facilitator superfamily MFS_1 [Rhodobacter sp. SW2]
MSGFGRFVAAAGMANLADGMAVLAWPWVASLLTRDALLIALVPVALRWPWLLFAIPAGLATDRLDRRRLVLAMDALRLFAFAAVALALWAALPLAPPTRGLAEPALFALLLAAALITGVAEVFRDNAAQTLLPALVPQAALEAANGRLWTVELLGNMLVGPPLAALLIAVALPLPFAANALAYLLAAGLMLRLAGNFRPLAVAGNGWRADLAEGWAGLRGTPLLLHLALITGVWNLFFQMVMIALVLHGQENLGLSATAFGLVLAAGALGGIFGGIFGARIIAVWGPARTAQAMLALSVPAFLVVGLAPGPVTLGLALMGFEFTGLVWNTVAVSYRQRATPDRLLGRVNSLYRLLATGMMPLGLVLAGVVTRLAETALPRALALTAPFAVATLGAAGLAFLGWRVLRRGGAALG